MKKVLAVTILCLALMGALSGCSSAVPKDDSASSESKSVPASDNPSAGEENSASEAETGEIVFWSLLGGGDGEILEAMINEYNATNPAYTVKHYVQDWGEYYNKLTFSVVSKEAPDLAISHATRLMQLADQQVIKPLSEVNGFETINWEDFVANAKDKASVEGEPYAIPFDFHGFLLYYNNDILSQCGIVTDNNVPLEIKSWDDFLLMLDKVKNLDVNKDDNKDNDIYPLGLQTDGDFPYKLWFNLYLQLGGTPLLSEDGSTVTIDEAAATTAIEMLLELYNKGYAGVFNNQWEDYKAGKSAFVVSFTSDVASFNAALGENFNVTGFPKLFDTYKVFADSHSFVFPVNDKRTPEKEQAIMAFVDWMVNSGDWMKTGHFPTAQSVLESEKYNALPFVQNYKDSVSVLESLSGSKSTWLMNPPKTIEGFENIYGQRETITPAEAYNIIKAGLENDK